MDIEQLRLLASRVRDYLQHSPFPVAHNKSLDLIAAVPGLRNWPEVMAFPNRVQTARFDLESASRLATRLKTIGLNISAELLFEEIAPTLSASADAPQIWPNGPKPGVYITTSQDAINALLQRYEHATDGALVYAERAGSAWEGSIDLGDAGLWSNGLSRVPSGTLMVVGPLEFDQQSWKDSAEHIHMATLHALNWGHRVAVLIDTPTPESMCEDAQLMVTSVEKPGDNCREGLLGIVTETGDLVERTPFARARPALTASKTQGTPDAIPERGRRVLQDVLAKRRTGLLLFGESDIREHAAIDLVAASLAMTDDVGPAARVMPRHRSTPAKDWLVPEAIKVLPYLPSVESAFDRGYRRIVFSAMYSSGDMIAKYAGKALLIGGVYANTVQDAYLTTLRSPMTNEGDPLGKIIAILTALKTPGKRAVEMATDLFVMPDNVKSAPTMRYEEINQFLEDHRVFKWQEELSELLVSGRVTVTALRKAHSRSNNVKEFLSQRATKNPRI